jgi:uncharacterized protein
MNKLLLLFALFYSMSAFSQQQEPAIQEEGKLKEYFFVMLKRGPVRSQDSITTAKLQEGHMANIQKMADEGHLAVAGPFGDDGDWRGIFIFKTKTIDEAKKLVEQDPMIRAGRLIYEIHPWWTMKGAKLD